eukprot:TRINITY_DN8730_c0_g1_i9.p1 TRINITY_DN8730_c0_g1~~TRINITY_DN8730_c0_g1_i9.p1  ORF type:complete len:404 (-),score=48.68 TRINITY_DN8730_c0_g1_i9:49-1260(-)
MCIRDRSYITAQVAKEPFIISQIETGRGQSQHDACKAEIKKYANLDRGLAKEVPLQIAKDIDFCAKGNNEEVKLFGLSKINKDCSNLVHVMNTDKELLTKADNETRQNSASVRIQRAYRRYLKAKRLQERREIAGKKIARAVTKWRENKRKEEIIKLYLSHCAALIQHSYRRYKLNQIYKSVRSSNKDTEYTKTRDKSNTAYNSARRYVDSDFDLSEGIELPRVVEKKKYLKRRTVYDPRKSIEASKRCKKDCVVTGSVKGLVSKDNSCIDKKLLTIQIENKIKVSVMQSSPNNVSSKEFKDFNKNSRNEIDKSHKTQGKAHNGKNKSPNNVKTRNFPTRNTASKAYFHNTLTLQKINASKYSTNKNSVRGKVTPAVDTNTVIKAVKTAVSYTHLTLPTIYSV